MKYKIVQENGAFYLKRSCSFCGQFVALEGKVSMGSISSEQLMSAVEEMNQSLLVPCTPYLKGCGGGVMWTPEKVTPWEVELKDNITSSQSLVSQFLSQLIYSFQGSNIGSQENDDDSSKVLKRVLKKSFIVKSFIYPLSNFMDQDDKIRFSEYVVWRDLNVEHYNSRHLVLVDMFQLLDMLLGYVLDKVERVLSVRLKLKP